MPITIPLTGPWRLRQVGTEDWVPAIVPGCVHTDLLAARRIPDPLVGMNELDVLWIDEADWEYERTFELDDELLSQPSQELVCEGLDTVAEVCINDQLVGRSFNMFRRYRFDVSGCLRSGTNTIRVTFRSPIRYGQREAANAPYELPGTEYDWGTGRKRKVYRPYIRKAQYQFGWDWGPCLATSGIWREIRLVASASPRFEYVTTQQQHEHKRVRLAISAHLHSPSATTGQLDVHIGQPSIGEAKTESWPERPTATVEAKLDPGENRITAEIAIESPALWWPVGLGEPNLYPLRVTWADQTGQVLDEFVTYLGLRDVELVRQPDEHGESFFFQINGVPVFAKGANWIPADPFPTRVDRGRYEQLIAAALEANMNMLRVWGGGIYEDHTFYELCDQHGLMVWQDFMFACAVYPVTETFLNEVQAEARHQMRRLCNHPSIVIWCGNNENEWAVSDWWHQQPSDPPLRPDYDRLTVDTLAPIVAEEDPGRPWWPSSPSNGGEGQANDLSHGDVHFWDVWHQNKPFERYLEVVPRFCSEFGFQSFPSLDTLRPAVGTDAESIDDPVMLHHQRHGLGNAMIAERIDRHFRTPKSLDHFCYLSQLTQGLALKTAVEHWRRSKPRCMGTLYWQLHDLWVVASWATIDYTMRRKAAHHIARRFFAPLLGSFVEDSANLHIWATSDLQSTTAGTWQLDLWNLRGTRQRSFGGEFKLAPQQSRPIASIPRADLLASEADLRHVFARLRLEAGELRHDNVHVFAPYRDLELPSAVVTATVQADQTRPRVRLSTDALAFFVELTAEGRSGAFSDNYMCLVPDEPVEVEFRGEMPDEASPADLAVRVRSLRDTC